VDAQTNGRTNLSCNLRSSPGDDLKIAKNSPSGHHRTTLLGYIFATKAHIDNRKNLFKQRYLQHMSLH